MYIYRVLAWNSRWRIPIGTTQSDLMTSLSHGTADWFSPISVANELSAQHSNIWLVLVVAVLQHALETLHRPQLHLYRSATRWFMYVIFAAAVFLTCSQQHVVDVLAIASLSTCSAAAAADLFRQDQTHYHANPSESCHDIYIYIYIYTYWQKIV